MRRDDEAPRAFLALLALAAGAWLFLMALLAAPVEW